MDDAEPRTPRVDQQLRRESGIRAQATGVSTKSRAVELDGRVTTFDKSAVARALERLRR